MDIGDSRRAALPGQLSRLRHNTTDLASWPLGRHAPRLGKAQLRWAEADHDPLPPRQAEAHLKINRSHFGSVPTSAVRPSDVGAWTVALTLEGRVDSYIYAIYSRLSQILTDAVHDGIVMRNPCSRRILLGMGKQGSRETSDQGVGTPV